VKVYVDSSVVLRVVLGERGRLASWRKITAPVTSELARVECFRTLDRARLAGVLTDDDIADRRTLVDEILAGFDRVALDRRILRRATEPFPTTIGTLDAIHLASALALRTSIPDLRFATHDVALAIGARAVGFQLAR
jgi:predicted nucleic acid-binding protein